MYVPDKSVWHLSRHAPRALSYRTFIIDATRQRIQQPLPGVSQLFCCGGGCCPHLLLSQLTHHLRRRCQTRHNITGRYWFDCANSPPTTDTYLENVAAVIRRNNPEAVIMTRNGVFSDYVETRVGLRFGFCGRHAALPSQQTTYGGCEFVGTVSTAYHAPPPSGSVCGTRART